MRTDTQPAVLDVRVRMTRPSGEGFTLDVAFDAPPGITILFGPSGSGKSTTLAAIAGLVKPDDGRIALGEEVWFDGAQHVNLAIQRRHVAFVFQSLALFPHMTAIANVEYGMDRTLPRPDRRRRAIETLDRLRVAHLAKRRPRTFSGGEAQRVALARAFATSPRLVLLDEPFSALDRVLRRDLASDLRSFVEEAKIPLIHVTHHRNEARYMGDRVVLLEGGRVKALGTTEQLLGASLDDEGAMTERRAIDDDTPYPPVRS